MKKQLLFGINLFLFLFLSSSGANQTIFAQNEKKEPLRLKWVKNDIDGIAELIKFTPVENQNIDLLKKQLKGKWSIDDDELGFGGNRVRFEKGYGYSSVYIDVLTFNNQIAYYEIGVIGSWSEWNRYREQIINAWKQNRGPEFSENGFALTYQKKFENVFDSYYRAVGAELGELKPVDAPSDLKNAYEYLISPMNNSYIGEGICGLGGSVLKGKTSIDSLIEAQRIDLIENVLKGLNPSGRIFAAIALLRMKQQGLKLSQETVAAINKVVNLNITVSTCAGCIVSSGRKPKDVIEDFVKR